MDKTSLEEKFEGIEAEAAEKAKIAAEDLADVAGGVVSDEAVEFVTKAVMISKLAKQSKATCKAGLERSLRNKFPNGYHGTTLDEMYGLVDQIWDTL